MFKTFTRFLCSLVIIAVMIVVITTPTQPAEAKVDHAPAILNCFHPEGAIFIGDEGECPSKPWEDNCVYEGTIYFKGIFTKKPYSMKFELFHRTIDGKRQCKITPGADTAPVEPDRGCYMRSWYVCGT